MNDFDSTATMITFNADEGGIPHTSLMALVPIVNDDIDEADSQFFFAHLVIVNALDESLIEITRNTSRCVIFDDDRKFFACYGYIDNNVAL